MVTETNTTRKKKEQHQVVGQAIEQKPSGASHQRQATETKQKVENREPSS